MNPTEEMTYRESVKEKLEKILAQTTKTNGRVTALERRFLILMTGVAVIILLKLPEYAPLLHLAA